MILVASAAIAGVAYFATNDSAVATSEKRTRTKVPRCPDIRRAHPPAANDYERWVELGYLAHDELAGGHFDRAATLATELLEQAPRYRGDWNFGNAIHHGNTVLGRVALARGDVPEARRRLLASAATEGSPQLNSFGPSMALAYELLQRGEAAIVLQYLERCRSFWEMGEDNLGRWEASVVANQTPKFGYNGCM